MTPSKKRALRAAWQTALVVGILVELVLVYLSVDALVRGIHHIPAWQQIAFVAIVVWIYIAYLKQRALDIAAGMIDEKVKTHSLVENLSEAVIVTDSMNRILLLNGVAARLTGCDPISSIEKDLRGMVSGDLRDLLDSGQSGDARGHFSETARDALATIAPLPTRRDEPPFKLITLVPAPNASPTAESTATPSAADELAAAGVDLASRLDPAAPAPDIARAFVPFLALAYRSALPDPADASTLPSAPLSVGALLAPVLDTLRPIAQLLNVELDTDGVQPDLPLNAPPAPVRGLLTHLILCALAESPTASAVRIRTAELGSNLAFSIADSGERAALPDLARAKSFIEALGGSLWSDSPEDRGLRVSFMLLRE